MRGKLIKRVVFSLDGKKIQSQAKGPYVVFVRALPGAHNVKARVTFKDATRAEDAGARLPRLRGRRAASQERPLAVHRMRRAALIAWPSRWWRRPPRPPALAASPRAALPGCP